MMKEKLASSLFFVKRETRQTKEMVLTFKQLLAHKLGDNEQPTKEEIEEALKQLQDLGKMSLLLPVIALPGSIITIPLLIKIAKKYNIDILPSYLVTNFSYDSIV